MFLLDTNACIAILKHSSLPLVERLHRHSASEIRIPSVAKAELLFGARRSLRVADNLRSLERFWVPYVSLPFDDRCAEHYGIVRTGLVARGQTIGPNDFLIASIALAHDLTLVTHNLGEFSRVPGLHLEDWEG